MKKSANWTLFLVQKEIDQKASLQELLEAPIKKLSQYYLQLEVKRKGRLLNLTFLQEVVEYTSSSHPDFEPLKSAITRFKEEVERQKRDGKRNSLTIRSDRPIISADSIFYDMKSNTVRISSKRKVMPLHKSPSFLQQLAAKKP